MTDLARTIDDAFEKRDGISPSTKGEVREAVESALDLLDSGNAYVNVHTNDGVDPVNTGPGDFPGGEIRAQISD